MIGARRLASAATGLLVARLAGAGLGLLTQLLLARLVPPGELGHLLLAMSLGSVLGVVAAVGYPGIAPRSLARFPRGRILGDAFTAAALRDSVLVGLFGAALAALAVAFWSPGPTAAILAIGAFAAPALAGSRVLGTIATAEHRFALAYLPEVLFRPLAFLLAVGGIALVTRPPPAIALASAFVGLALLQFVVQFWKLRPARRADGLASARARRLARAWRRQGAPLVFSALLTSTFGDLVVLSAGLFLTSAELAVFAIAVKLAYIAGFAVQVVQQLVMPSVANAYAARQAEAVRAHLATGNLVALGLASAALLGGALVGPWVLRLFGDAYPAGYWPLMVLLAGLALRAAAGPGLQVLALHRRTGIPPLLAAAALLVLVLVAVLLAPAFGAFGAALAAFSAEAAWSVGGSIAAALAAGQRVDILVALPPAAARLRALWAARRASRSRGARPEPARPCSRSPPRDADEAFAGHGGERVGTG